MQPTVDMIALSPAEYQALRSWATKGINAYANEAYRDGAIVSQLSAIEAAREAGLVELAKQMERDLQ